MDRMQEKLAAMLSWFHDFCRAEGLCYYMVGGTLLGAVRHRGFIPWDNDIDIGMPRKDYRRFLEKMRGRPSPRYVAESIYDPVPQRDFVYPFAKLYDTATTLVENTRYRTARGIYLDIFPLDGIGDSEEESRRNFARIDRQSKAITARAAALNRHRSSYKNAAILLSRCVPECLFPLRRRMQAFDRLCATRDFATSIYVANLMGNWGVREIARREWFGTPRLYEFEGMQICGPQDADSYLRGVYGDYMTLPPAEKQVSHHDYIHLDLEKSYLTEGEKA